MRTTTILAVVLAGGALVAGCGGDSAPSRAEYARSADKVCTEINRQIADLRTGSTPQELDRALTAARKQLDAGVKRLSALERPTGSDGDLAKQWIDQLTRETKRFEPVLGELQAALRARDAKRIRAVSRRLDSFNSTASDRLARKLGMKACAS